ncbi:hypothetical protein [Dyadobacter frigoris]|uniref:Uncharacterized protein n=1 Tax=Dyadobacter frigoris TaxID=2576211 RepID=A0A4U6DDR5_9BACT|nr:hypothetical protein [Dyadobacter frigoris]TKT92594.1 hypothetical protein FDK13_07160 [Dyadobacter frigoris]GLU51479.1 hypothetical protein Dfri01_09400 [Dyadobacter frigoris]
METAYKNIGYFFIGLLALTFAGFYITYFGQFPEFKNLTPIHHFHALIFIAWYTVLIIQPFLIRYKKFALHRLVGKFSYFLMPLVLISIFMATQTSYKNGIVQHLPEKEVLAGTFMNLLSLFLFGLFYLLAMINRHHTPAHLRYIITSSLILIGPALGRILIMFFGFSFPDGVWYGGMMVPALIMLALILLDIKNNRNYTPYIISLLLSLALDLAWKYNFQSTALWQNFADIIF